MYQDLSDQELKLVDAVCEQYERAIRNNADTKIDEWLTKVPETIREVLLGELIAIQFEDISLEQAELERQRLLKQLPKHKAAIGKLFDNLQQKLPKAETAGRYRILHRHASGGLGDVYLAHDLELDRDVALKQIQTRHSGNPNSRVRFVLEAEVTGRLEHPSIVPVYGLGEYSDGRPYYAMRFIRGKSMKAAIEEFHGKVGPYPSSSDDDRKAERKQETQEHKSTAKDNTCQQPTRSEQALEETGDDHSASLVLGGDDLSFSVSPSVDPGREQTKKEQPHSADYSLFELRKLLNRFIDVCQAVSYAHSSGVLHRDLKPANVMLGEFGETFVVDWGLAKLRSVKVESENDSSSSIASSDSLAATAAGSVVGTLQYMPPEQAEGRIEELTNQSDVYSLGATLYHLLAGRTPDFGNSIPEVRQNIIRGNFTPPRQFQSAIPKPLEAICLKAMATNPEDRYLGAGELADDLERFLADEAVDAWVDPLPVRVRRWLKKHQTFAVATAVGVGLLVIGLSVFSLVLGSKNAELANLNGKLESTNEDLDQKNEQLVVANEVAEAARTKAENSSERFSKALQFYVNSFRSVDPTLGANKWMSAKEVLRLAYDHVEETLGDDVQTKSILLDALARSFTGIGEYELAVESSAKAAQYVLLSEEATEEEVVHVHNNMVRASLDNRNNEKIVELAKDTLELAREKLGADHRYTIRANICLADAYQVTGEFDEYLKLCLNQLDYFVDRFGENSLEVGQLYGRMADAYEAYQMFEPALEYYEKAVDIIVSVTGPSSIDSFRARNNHALCLFKSGDRKKALSLCKELVDEKKEVLGDEHPSTIMTHQIYGRILRGNNRKREGMRVYEHVLEMARKQIGEAHPFTHACINNLAICYEEVRRLDDAETLYKEVIKLRLKYIPEDHYDQTQSWDNYAILLSRSGRVKEAFPYFKKAMEVTQKTFGLADPRTAGSKLNLARQYGTLNHFEDAIEVYKEVLPLYEEALGPNSENPMLILNELGSCYAALGDFDSSIEAYQQVYQRRLEVGGPKDPDTIEALKWLQLIQLRTEKYEDAHDSIQLWLELLEGNARRSFHELGWAKASEAQALLAAKEYEKAIDSADITIGMRSSPPDSIATAKSIKGACLAELIPDELAEAQKLLTEGFDELEALADRTHKDHLFELENAGHRLEKFLEKSNQTEALNDHKARFAAVREKIAEKFRPVELDE